MNYTFDSNIVSDLYKDTFGFRPSELFWTQWLCASDDEKQKIWDRLERALVVTMEFERDQELRAMVAFENLVERHIQSGALDREAALRWIMDASKCNGDWEFLCWEHGLPYGYFGKVDGQ